MIRKALAACVLMIALSAFSTAAIAGLAEECSALFERGNQYYQHGDYARATESLERAARIAENAFGSNSPNVGLVYNSLSTAYMAQGRFADAEPFLKRAIQIRERNVGPNSVDLVPVLTNLGQVYDNQSRYEEAEALYKRVLAIQQASVGADHPSV
ncbi:MAG TPA: tetratricopeptide repeat protein, partial [Bradyrhizobium sp.]